MATEVTKKSLALWEGQPVVQMARDSCPPDVPFVDFLQALDGILTDLELNHPEAWHAVMRGGGGVIDTEQGREREGGRFKAADGITCGQKQIYDMVMVDGMKPSQVAAQLGCSRAYVSKVLAKVRKFLGSPQLSSV